MNDTTLDLAVLVACFNRAQMTHRAVSQILVAAKQAGVDAHIFVLNDGSSDDTTLLLESLGAPVTVIEGPGDFFWAKSMATAEEKAIRQVSDSGHLLWLNDDVELDVDAVEQAILTARQRPNEVFIGMTVDPDEPGSITYSAFRWKGPHPLNYVQVQTSSDSIDAFNGNFVLIPSWIARQVGGIEGNYSHALADIDYGRRIRRAGYKMSLIERPVGTCARNADPSGTVRTRWRIFIGPKGGGNPQSLLMYLRRARPISWPFWFLATYAQWWRRAVTKTVHKRPQQNRSA